MFSLPWPVRRQCLFRSQADHVTGYASRARGALDDTPRPSAAACRTMAAAQKTLTRPHRPRFRPCALHLLPYHRYHPSCRSNRAHTSALEARSFSRGAVAHRCVGSPTTRWCPRSSSSRTTPSSSSPARLATSSTPCVHPTFFTLITTPISRAVRTTIPRPRSAPIASPCRTTNVRLRPSRLLAYSTSPHVPRRLSTTRPRTTPLPCVLLPSLHSPRQPAPSLARSAHSTSTPPTPPGHPLPSFPHPPARLTTIPAMSTSTKTRTLGPTAHTACRPPRPICSVASVSPWPASSRAMSSAAATDSTSPPTHSAPHPPSCPHPSCPAGRVAAEAEAVPRASPSRPDPAPHERPELPRALPAALGARIADRLAFGMTPIHPQHQLHPASPPPHSAVAGPDHLGLPRNTSWSGPVYHAPLAYPTQHSVGASMPGSRAGSRAGSPPIVLPSFKRGYYDPPLPGTMSSVVSACGPPRDIPRLSHAPRRRNRLHTTSIRAVRRQCMCASVISLQLQGTRLARVRPAAKVRTCACYCVVVAHIFPQCLPAGILMITGGGSLRGSPVLCDPQYGM